MPKIIIMFDKICLTDRKGSFAKGSKSGTMHQKLFYSNEIRALQARTHNLHDLPFL